MVLKMIQSYPEQLLFLWTLITIGVFMGFIAEELNKPKKKRDIGRILFYFVWGLVGGLGVILSLLRIT